MEAGNQSYGVMLVQMLNLMSERIEDAEMEEEEADAKKLRTRIRELEFENRQMRMKLEYIASMFAS